MTRKQVAISVALIAAILLVSYFLVRPTLLRGVQPAPELDTADSAPGPSKGDSTPLKRISGYRAPLAPRLARPRNISGTHSLER